MTETNEDWFLHYTGTMDGDPIGAAGLDVHTDRMDEGVQVVKTAHFEDEDYDKIYSELCAEWVLFNSGLDVEIEGEKLIELAASTGIEDEEREEAHDGAACVYLDLDDARALRDRLDELIEDA